MKRIIEWCMHRAPNDLGQSDVYTIIDLFYEQYYKRVLLKNIDIDEDRLEHYTPDDFMNTPIEVQYPTLLAYLYHTGIANIPAETIKLYLSWMFDDPEIYEPGFTAYVWSESCLNSVSSHRLHSVMLSVADAGCDSKTLKFLWEAALHEDPVLCRVIAAVGTTLGPKRYLEIVVYTYMCSQYDYMKLSLFFCDIDRIPDRDITAFSEYYCTYNWTSNVMDVLFEKNYSIFYLYKYIMRYEDHGFMGKNRTFPLSYLPSRVFPAKSGLIVCKLKELPAIPDEYQIDFAFFNKHLKFVTPLESGILISKYKSWYRSLTASQKRSLMGRNPVVYEACEKEQFNLVSPLLDCLMLEV